MIIVALIGVLQSGVINLMQVIPTSPRRKATAVIGSSFVSSSPVLLICCVCSRFCVQLTVFTVYWIALTTLVSSLCLHCAVVCLHSIRD